MFKVHTKWLTEGRHWQYSADAWARNAKVIQLLGYPDRWLQPTYCLVLLWSLWHCNKGKTIALVAGSRTCKQRTPQKQTKTKDVQEDTLQVISQANTTEMRHLLLRDTPQHVELLTHKASSSNFASLQQVRWNIQQVRWNATTSTAASRPVVCQFLLC